MNDDGPLFEDIDFTHIFGFRNYTRASMSCYAALAIIGTFHDHEIQYATSYHQEQSGAVEPVADPTLLYDVARSMEFDEYLTNVEGLGEWDHFYMINSSCIQMAVTALEVYVHQVWRELYKARNWKLLSPKVGLSEAVERFRLNLNIPKSSNIPTILTVRNKLTHQDGYLPNTVDKKELELYCRVNPKGRIEVDEELVRTVIHDLQEFVDAVETTVERTATTGGAGA